MQTDRNPGLFRIEHFSGALRNPHLLACLKGLGQHILEVCKWANLSVPEDVSVLGVDNDPMICDLSDPPLSSIQLNAEAAGYKAAAMMNEMIENKKIAGSQILVSPSHIAKTIIRRISHK